MPTASRFRMATKIMFLAALVLFSSVAAVEDTADVKELADEDSQPTLANGGIDTHGGTAGGGPGFWSRDANFVGPKYGLPGYKESHNWEEDFDVMSPLVFDWRMYRALIDKKSDELAALTEESLKQHWVDAVSTRKAPECPQGNLWFNANTYEKKYQEYNEFAMGGSSCKLILQVYLQKGIFVGDLVVNHYGAGANQFPTVATKLFDPERQEDSSQSRAYFEASTAQYFNAPKIGAPRRADLFAPARHMTLAFWLKIGPQELAPNAELFAYGATDEENYFRTGFGCITKDITPGPVDESPSSKCYFIFVFDAMEKEFFHSYEESNFNKLNNAFTASQWAHVVMMLTTTSPGGYAADKEDGETYCSDNGGSQQDPKCAASLWFYVNKQRIELVDWNEGTDTLRSGQNGWGSGLANTFWEEVTTTGKEGGQLLRRFWVTPPQTCDDGPEKCGDVMENGLKWAFPWHGSYKSGLYVCSLMNIPSGTGGFGNKARREVALEAMYDTMSETRNIACSFEVSEGATSQSDQTMPVARIETTRVDPDTKL